MDDVSLIRDLVPHWYSTRRWAEELLVRALGLTDAKDVLTTQHRGRKPIPGSNWTYRTHGCGVDLFRTSGGGGIDFDFDKPNPDCWRLRLFAEKQWHVGNLPQTYQHLIEDEDRFDKLAAAVIAEL
jgi:hypothetical protein